MFPVEDGDNDDHHNEAEPKTNWRLVWIAVICAAVAVLALVFMIAQQPAPPTVG